VNLDVDQLLTIDVESEIRKLAEAELGGSWQIPAELVRRSLRSGAQRVDVEVTRTLTRLADDGRPIDAETVRSLLTLLDAAQAPAARHRALLELEALGEVGLVALAGLSSAGVRIASDGVELLRRGAPPPGALARRGTVIELYGADLDVAEAKRWLQLAVRFAPARVLLGGAEIVRGASEAIVEVPLQRPLSGQLALLREADGARVWMLRWGVVATHTTLPGGLAVEAAIELGDRATKQVGAGELRAAFKGELEELEAQAIELAVATAGQLQLLEPADRARVRMLLLGSAKLSKLPEVRKVKMLPALYGPTQALEWTSVEQLLRHAAGKSALAVDSEAKAANAVTHQPIFVLAPSERARLSQLFGVSFAPPPSAVTGGPILSLRGLAESSARFARSAVGVVAAACRSRCRSRR